MWYLFLRAGVLDRFLTADRSTLDNLTSDHPGSAVELASGGGGGGFVGVVRTVSGSSQELLLFLKQKTFLFSGTFVIGRPRGLRVSMSHIEGPP